jgi:hypothetical protein
VTAPDAAEFSGPKEGLMAVQQDRFDAMSDDDLVRHLEAAASERREQLVLGKRTSNLGNDEWVAETVMEGGLSGRTVMFSATGSSRRDVMLALARVLPLR